MKRMSMATGSGFTFRQARGGDGQAVFDVTFLSVKALAKHHYTPGQIAAWMGDRTPFTYEVLIGQGRMIVAERQKTIFGFVDAEPGEITRLFLRPEAAGQGLGTRLLDHGIVAARKGHDGPIKVEATLNAAGFYARHGFRATGSGFFSHGLGGEPIEIVRMEF